ncbi:peptide/nickel transport system permease protein [Paenibacillus sp. BK033]|uniref:ABC transporter permease n=1 Tax=Paenibacillus sp. BK033 TaxID=2512133 RepID=UPI0010450C85|nr:ABC transporter permease [Paenibacillus sp. BK033]TCM99670.1 peptide/nickel transport system permease protein [Paenibacillus sp. BK033]
MRRFGRRQAAATEPAIDKDLNYSSQWRLMYVRFKKHKLARVSLVILAFLYAGALFAQFLAPYGLENYDSKYVNAAPMKLRFVDAEGKFHIRPFVYGLKSGRDPETMRKTFTADTEKKYRLQFFVKGEKYKFLGLIPSSTHLIGVKEPGRLFLLGTDSLGRDLFSRILLGSQVSLSIPLVGVGISFVLGLIIGGASGYFGGWVDAVIQRVIEIIRSFPTLPLWMALSAAIPPRIPVVRMYFYIVIIFAFIEWTGLARVVRGKFISLKNEDYVVAAKIAGVSDSKIMVKHLLPGFISYLVVATTLAIPGMILAETAMSFLGLGIRSPATSWGVLLQEAQKIDNIALYPWKIIPLGTVILTVLTFNFLGDGLRDAADPYKR